MQLNDFCAICERLAGEGVQVDKAQYDGLTFGSWYIEISADGRPARRLIWDGREGWLLLQSRDAKSRWKDEWMGRDPEQQTVEQAITRLRE